MAEEADGKAVTKMLSLIGCAAALLAQLLIAAPGAAQTYPLQTDYVCTAKSDTGEPDDQRIRVDLVAKAWCTSKDGCKEIKTLFGVHGDRVILESSQLEVASYETFIDRATGAYSSFVNAGGIANSSQGACKVAPFTPFGVKLDGSKITGG